MRNRKRTTFLSIVNEGDTVKEKVSKIVKGHTGLSLRNQGKELHFILISEVLEGMEPK